MAYSELCDSLYKRLTAKKYLGIINNYFCIVNKGKLHKGGGFQIWSWLVSVLNRDLVDTRRIAERGNVFFTLFGAVAVVGVLGAGIMSTMRGPLTTMVEVNRIEETKADLRLSARMILLKSKDNNATGEVTATEGAAGTNQYTEALEPGAPVSGMGAGFGTIPGTAGAKQKDAWGTSVGYCAWNNGPDNVARGRWLAGSNDQNAVALALISAGPDRKFTTECKDADDFVDQSSLGDDIVVQLDYGQAVSGSGGLWSAVQMTDDGGATIEGAQINRALSVTSTGTSQFSGGAAFQESVRTEGQIETDMISPFPGTTPLDYIEFTGSVLLPEKTGLSCGASNKGAISYDDSETIVSFCDGTSWQPLGKKFWIEDANGIRNNNTLAPHVGIGAGSDGAASLNVGGGTKTDTLAASSNATIGGTLGVTGASTLGSTLGVTGATTLSSTLGVVGAAELDSALGVDGTSEFRNDVTAKSDVFIQKAGGAKGNLVVQDKITATEGNITATAGDVVATSGDVTAIAGDVTAGNDVTAANNITATGGDIAATAGNVTAGGSITAGSNITATSGNIVAEAGKIIGESFHRGSDTAPDFSDIDNCDNDTEKLMWSSSGWSCQPDLGAGSGTGGAQTLSEVLSNGDDADGRDARDFGRLGADEYCDAEFGICIPSTDLINGSQIWKKDGPGSATGEIYYNGGYVGIGTNDPWTNLDLVNGGAALGAIAFNSYWDGSGWRQRTNGWGGYLQFDNAAGRLVYWNSPASANADAANPLSTISLAILPSGNMGVGTGVPDTKLSVAGTLKIGDGAELCDSPAHEGAMRYVAATDAFEMCRSSATGWEPLGAGGEGGGIWEPNDPDDPKFIRYDDALGGMKVGKVAGAAPATGWTYNPAVPIISTSGKAGATQFCDPTGVTCFYPGDLAGSNLGLWQNDGPEGNNGEIYYSGGNVGIGTNDPSSALTVAGATSQVELNKDGSIEIARDETVNPDVGGFIDFKRLKTDDLGVRIGFDKYYDGGIGGFYVETDTDGGGAWGTVRRMVIENASGNMGIGLDDPKTKLDIGGTLKIGDGTELCNSVDHEGALKYDAAFDNFYMCRKSSTGWELLGSGSGGGGGGADTLAGLSCTTGQVAQWSGTAWACASVSGGGSGQDVSFLVNRNGTNQTITTDTWSKILFTNEVFDTGNSFDSGANSRFQPTVAGKYIINLNVLCVNGNCGAGIYKNGVIAGAGQLRNSPDAVSSASIILSLNGTTDYVEGYAYIGGGNTIGGSSSAFTYMSGALISGGGGSGTDTLAGLSCSTGQVAQWNGTAWACASVSGGGIGGGVAGWVSFNGSTGAIRASSANITSVTRNGLGDYTINFNPLADTNFGWSGGGNYGTASDQSLRGFWEASRTTSTLRVRYQAVNSTAQAAEDPAYASIAIYSGSGSGGDTLAGLSCTTGQVAQWNGTAWACAASGAGLWTDSGNGYLEYSGLDKGVKINKISGLPNPDVPLASGLVWDADTSTLMVDGNIEITGELTDASDIRLKDEVRGLGERGSMLERIRAIQPVSFKMKRGDGRTEFGVIAQELEEVFPELVATDNSQGGFKSVNYTGLIAPLISAAQELDRSNEALRFENGRLAADVLDLREQIEMDRASVMDLKDQVALLSKIAGAGSGKAASGGLLILFMFFGGGIFVLLVCVPYFVGRKAN